MRIKKLIKILQKHDPLLPVEFHPAWSATHYYKDSYIKYKTEKGVDKPDRLIIVLDEVKTK